MSNGTHHVKAHTAEITITDTDGSTWTFELVQAVANEPINVSVGVEVQQVEMPSEDGISRHFVPGPAHVTVQANGRLKGRTETPA